MVRMLVIVTLLLGGVCPVQLPSSHLILTSTQTLYDSYLISCTAAIPEERVTQVHWKERLADGKYNMIAVLNAVWGNATQLSYQLIVKLSKMDETTYTLEIAEASKVVCCEVITYPSGMVQENCLTVEGDSVSGGRNIESALVGTLVVSGFFIFGSLILICHICWTKKNSRQFREEKTVDENHTYTKKTQSLTTRRIFNLRGVTREVWNRAQSSQVPYTRNSPSVNLAYEPPIEANLLNNEATQRPHTQHGEPANPQPFEGPPTRASEQYQISLPRNQWLSESSLPVDPPPYTSSSSVPPPRIHVIPEHTSTENHIYSNIRRQNRQRLKMPHLQNTQNEPVGDQPEMFPYASSTQSSSGNSYHTTSAPCLCGDTSYFSEDPASLQPPRLHVPMTPEPLFSTINPMYHSRPAWESQPSKAHFKYPHTALS